MAETPKTPKIAYKLTKDTEKAIDDYATLAADTYRARHRVTHPAMDPKELDAKCLQCKKETAAKLTKEMAGVVADLNNEINKAAKDGKTVTIEVGSQDIDLDSQANMDKALRAIIETGHVQDVKREKAYYDKHLQMRATLQQREDGIKAGKMGFFTDLDMARLHTLNKEISDAGDALGISKTKLAVDMQRYELRAFESRLKSKEKPTSYEERSISDDARRVALVKEWLARDEKLLEAELKKAAEEKALNGKGTPAAPAIMPPAKEKPEVLPPPMEIKPPESPGKKPSGAVMESAKEEVARILSGESGFTSDHVALPKRASQKAQMV